MSAAETSSKRAERHLSDLVMHLFVWVFFTAWFAIGSSALAAIAEQDSLAQPPLAVTALLDKAQILERSADEFEGLWEAAGAYCSASRLGSTEAQYRLGMLYAFGRGVPESREMAASLFSVAAAQGHVQAQNMLETIHMTSTVLPGCVISDALPDRAIQPVRQAATVGGIEKFLESVPKDRRWVIDLVSPLARWHSVDPKLILSIIAAESNFQIQAKSAKAAMGLMQLIPETAERFNVSNAYNATQNIRGGLAYVRWLLSYYQGDVKLTLAAYNSGEGTVDRYKGIPPYKETRLYVQRVMALYGQATHPFDAVAGRISPTQVVRKPAANPGQ